MVSFGRLNQHGNVHLLRDKFKPGKAPSGKVKVPDEIILDMRRKHEIERMPHWQVMDAYPQYPKEYVRRVLNYILRAHLRLP